METNNMLRTTIHRLILVAPLLALTLGASIARADLSTWPSSMGISVAGYNKTDVLTNFPVLVVLSNGCAGFYYSAMSSPANGADLRFSVDRLNEINYEIDQWNTNGASTVWVQIPAFQSNQAFYAHWGAAAPKPNYTTNGSTWSNNYVAVWHLNEQVTAGASGGSHYDSTTNVNTGTQSKNGWTNGLIGRAQNFDRTATINCGNKASLRPTDITIAAWIQPRNISYTTYVEIYRKEDGGNRHLLSFQNSGITLAFGIAPGGTYGETDISVSAADYTGAWHHVAATYNGSVRKVYRDGVEISTVNASGALTTSGTANGYIGSSAGSEFFDGLIDQLEISGVGRSSNWVWASYMQVVSNQSFLTYGSDLPVIANLDATNVTPTAAWLRGSLLSTGNAPATVSVYWGERDGGAPNSGLWQATNTWNQGAWGQNSFPSYQASLASNKFYYYRFYATNASGHSWAPSSSFFMTAPVTIQATTPDAWEANTVPGVFTVSRASTLTNEPLTVNYNVGGTATGGVDYASLSRTLLLGVGQASNTITVSPFVDADTNEPDKTVMVTLTPGLFTLADPSNATVTIRNDTNQTWYCALTNTQNKNWSDATTWTNAAGLNGVPTISDAAVVRTLASGNFTLNLDAGWNAKSLTLNSIASAQHSLNVANGYVETLTISNASPSGFNGLFWEVGASKVTVSKFRSVGYNTPNWRSTAWTSILAFTNAAEIIYHTGDLFNFANKYDFSAATSVVLAASTARATTTAEMLGPLGGNIAPPLVIGRNDNGMQNWTVAAGSHPLMRVTHYTQGSVISKVGAGDVNMPDVDLYIPFGNNCGISPDGAYGFSGGLYQGKITAHSLKLDGGGAVYFSVCGQLVLTGQGGMQAGGAGDGHALNVSIAGTNELNVNIGSGYWGGLSWTPGKIECLPTAGDLFLSCSNPTSQLKFVTCGFNRASTPNSSQVSIVANTINIANTNVYLTDRSPDGEGTDSYAGGQIEFRGEFICRSQLTNSFRLENTTMRVIGGGTNAIQQWECMSSTSAGGGSNNFVIGKMVLGQTATGSVSKAELMLRDLYDNNTGDAGAPEALYVTNLTMYANSILYLNGSALYCKNSGSWVQQPTGRYSPGDNTGYILNIPRTASGTVFTVR